MRKALPLLLLCLLLFGGSAATRAEISEQAQLSLLTNGPGEETWTAWGHSALRLYDPATGENLLFNYGTFEFGPGFEVKFMRGRLNYRLAVSTFPQEKWSKVVEGYAKRGEFLHEQVLNLTPEEVQQLYDFLIWNYEPENRYYLYDFFWDNCSTRIRDLFEDELGNKITWHHSFADDKTTFRDLIEPYIGHQGWLDFGIDLMLGVRTDRKATAREFMFLPDYLELAFDEATITHNGVTEPLVKETIIHTPQKAYYPSGQGLASPFAVFSILFIVLAVLTYIGHRKGARLVGIDMALFSILGLLGIFFLLGWFATDHKVLPYNLNLLWAFPLHIVAAIRLRKQYFSNFSKMYFLVTGLVCVLLLLAWPILPQAYHIAVLPILLIIALRSFYIYWNNRQKTLTSARAVA